MAFETHISGHCKFICRKKMVIYLSMKKKIELSPTEMCRAKDREIS